MDSAGIRRNPMARHSASKSFESYEFQLIGGGPGGGDRLRPTGHAPTLCLEILGNPRFQLIGGGPGGGDGLRRNPPESAGIRRNPDGPTLDLEILGNPTKSIGIFESSLIGGGPGGGNGLRRNPS